MTTTTTGGDHEQTGAPASALASAPPPPAGAARNGGASWWSWLFGFFLVAGLLAFQLFVDFRGLSEAKGMEQAVVARELARGNGFQTSIIDPLTVMRGDERGGEAGTEKVWTLNSVPATGIGPLQPMVNALGLKLCGWEHAVDAQRRVDFADRLIAALASLCFLVAVALTFVLVRGLFDQTLATATALVLLLSDLLWRYSVSGLPHMLALMLLMLAMMALLRAVMSWQEDPRRHPLAALITSGACCGLMILALPLAASLVIGLAVFVTAFFRRRLWLAGVFVGVALLVVAPWWLRNASLPGGSSLLGIAEARLISEPGVISESRVKSVYDANDRALKRVDPVKKLPRQLGVVLASLWTFTGGALAALLFFVSLLHPFRSAPVAVLRWALLAAWLAACVGMALAGLDASQPVDSAALHVLFLPLFSAYGLAFVSVLWNRTALARNRFSLWRHAHLMFIVVLTALPLLLALPGRLLLAQQLGGRLVHWPPFDAYTVSKIGDWTAADVVFVSDLPEAVAWYADRSTLRLPASPQTCAVLLQRAGDSGLHPAGFYLSPLAVDGRWISDIMRGEHEPWAALLLRSEAAGPAADLLREFEFRHWLNLSPTANQRAWLICDQAYWRS